MVQVAGIFWLRETFAPVLLERKARKLRQEMGLAKDEAHRVITAFDESSRSWKTIFAKALLRPFDLFFREPIIWSFGLYIAFL